MGVLQLNPADSTGTQLKGNYDVHRQFRSQLGLGFQRAVILRMPGAVGSKQSLC